MLFKFLMIKNKYREWTNCKLVITNQSSVSK